MDYHKKNITKPNKIITNLYKCTIHSPSIEIFDKVVYLRCSSVKKLKKMFEENFNTPGARYYFYNSVSIKENITLDSFDMVDQIKVNMPDTAAATLSKKKLYDIIKRVVNENDLMRDLNKKNEINYLVNVVIREIKGKASPETIREILIKIIKRKIKHLKRNNIEITLAQACSFNKFCLDCRYVGINNKSGGYKIELCEKHKDDSKTIKKMLDDDVKNYCPTCKTLSHFFDNELICTNNDCRVVGFFTG